MITLYAHPSQNVLKVLILLEELGQPYTVVNDRILEEGSPDWWAFRRASPTGQVPGIYDPDTDVALFESSAILLYLADKFGQFVPPLSEPKARAEAVKWLMFEAASLTPAMIDIYHYTLQAENEQPYSEDRARGRVRRALDVLEACLQDDRDYLAGDYSIADMILYPWMTILEDFADIPFADYPALEQWTARLSARPAIQRAEQA